ncbi:MAG TPA: ATP-binding cassette domain-containing protein [Marinagarivorans sp.]
MLTLDNLSLRIGRRHLLRDINGSFAAGEFIAILGENGAGKSTLLRAIASHKRSEHSITTRGDIVLGGTPLGAWSHRQLANKRAVMEQHNAPPAFLTVQELVMMGRFGHNESMWHANRYAERWLQRLQLDTLKDQALSRLSGGQQQRGHLARCFAQIDDTALPASEPSVDNSQAIDYEAIYPADKMLLLDEPTSALDVYHQHRCLKHAKAFANAGNLVIAVMHDINLAALYANRIALLHSGKLMALGKPAEVLREDTLQTMYRVKMNVQRPPDGTPFVISRPFAEHADHQDGELLAVD